jgi:hypothetical protein
MVGFGGLWWALVGFGGHFSFSVLFLHWQIGFGSAIKKDRRRAGVGVKVYYYFVRSMVLILSGNMPTTPTTSFMHHSHHSRGGGVVCVICDEYIGSSRIHLSELEK